MAAAVSIPVWLDTAALVVGSLAGGATATTRKLDLVGHVGLALICGLGGGLIRDVVMQVGTANVYMISSPYAIVVSAAVGVAVFLFPGIVGAHPHLLEWLDITSVGLFCAVGTDKAIVYNLNVAAVVLMGTLTGVGGGMLRDVTLGDVPRIFQRSNLYATCAVAGSAAYYACVGVAGVPKHLAVAACVATCVALRRWSLRFDVQSPTDANLERHVRRVGAQVRDKVVAATSASAATSTDAAGSEGAAADTGNAASTDAATSKGATASTGTATSTGATASAGTAASAGVAGSTGATTSTDATTSKGTAASTGAAGSRGVAADQDTTAD